MPDLASEAARLEQDVGDALEKILEDESAPQAAWEAARAIKLKQLQGRLAQSLGDYGRGAVQLIALIDQLSAAVQGMGSRSGGAAPALRAVRERASELHRHFHDAEGMRRADDATDVSLAAPRDEEVLPVPTPAERAEGSAGIGDAVAGAPALAAPRPSKSTDFAQLADEYVRFFGGAGFASPDARQQVASLAAIAKTNRARYQKVGEELGIPWWFIAGVHMLESSFNFETHLHNGDPLAARTVRVPAGRPLAGGPRFTWEESAKDALTLQKLAGLSDWSLPRALFRWEAYNGFGYRRLEVASPYLWGLSTIYRKGKFVRDGAFDPDAVSKQCGAATLLKHLHLAGEVRLELDFVGEKEAELAPQFERDMQDAAAAPPSPPPPVQPIPADATPFDRFLMEKLPGLRHFKPSEFLVGGGGNARLALNTPPPQELWPNVVDLVRVLDEFRARIGKPVMLNSVYRNEAYNQAIGGVSGSQHKHFRAADFQVIGGGTPAQWARLLRDMRAEKLFQGGIGLYSTFVHVDTRGWNAEWPAGFAAAVAAAAPIGAASIAPAPIAVAPSGGSRLVTADQLRAIMPDMPAARAEAWAQPLSDAMARWRITSVPARAAFLAVCGEESGFFKATRENLNYDAAGLARTWNMFSKTGNRRTRPEQPTDEAVALQRQPQAIANRVYHNPDMGNVDPNDGWDFRGGGPIQITWRATWQKCAEAHGLNLDRNALAAWADTASNDPAQAASCSAWFFAVFKPKILPLADSGNEADFLKACEHVGAAVNDGVIETWLRLWRKGLQVLA